jgi:hypothetical protein
MCHTQISMVSRLTWKLAYVARSPWTSLFSLKQESMTWNLIIKIFSVDFPSTSYLLTTGIVFKFSLRRLHPSPTMNKTPRQDRRILIVQFRTVVPFEARAAIRSTRSSRGFGICWHMTIIPRTNTRRIQTALISVFHRLADVDSTGSGTLRTCWHLVNIPRTSSRTLRTSWRAARSCRRGAPSCRHMATIPRTVTTRIQEALVRVFLGGLANAHSTSSRTLRTCWRVAPSCRHMATIPRTVTTRIQEALIEALLHLLITTSSTLSRLT